MSTKKQSGTRSRRNPDYVSRLARVSVPDDAWMAIEQDRVASGVSLSTALSQLVIAGLKARKH
jgi:hypothetical protein